MIAGRIRLDVLRAIARAAGYRTLSGERVYMAALGNGGMIAWAA